MMPCYHPVAAYRDVNGVFFSQLRGRSGESISLSCGQCIGCRLERSRQWAVRIMHEASLWTENCFVTLTYDEQHLAADRSLVYRDFQLFMRRLRKLRAGSPVRFFMSGEYGDDKGRPHFHACLFNVGFLDRSYYMKSPACFDLYRSAELENLWRNGFSSIGDLTFESAAYVARYILKKQTGDGEDKYYPVVDVTTGEVVPRMKEFCRMSLKPGIGSDWLRLYWKEVAVAGKVVCRGREAPAPRYYLRKMTKLDGYAMVELDRQERARAHAHDRTPERLVVREQVALAAGRQLKRVLK